MMNLALNVWVLITMPEKLDQILLLSKVFIFTGERVPTHLTFQMIDVLAYLESINLTHYDFKPANILYNREENSDEAYRFWRCLRCLEIMVLHLH